MLPPQANSAGHARTHARTRTHPFATHKTHARAAPTCLHGLLPDAGDMLCGGLHPDAQGPRGGARPAGCAGLQLGGAATGVLQTGLHPGCGRAAQAWGG
jgi:hypothetical protein